MGKLCIFVEGFDNDIYLSILALKADDIILFLSDAFHNFELIDDEEVGFKKQLVSSCLDLYFFLINIKDSSFWLCIFIVLIDDVLL